MQMVSGPAVVSPPTSGQRCWAARASKPWLKASSQALSAARSGGSASDEGCGCASTSGYPAPGGALYFILIFLGLGGLRLRRR